MANPILKSEIIDHEGIVEVLDIVINKAKELEKVLEGTLIEMAKEARELKNEMANTRASLDKVIPPETASRVYDLNNAFKGVLKNYSDIQDAVSSLQITQKNHNDLIKAQKQYVEANGQSYNNLVAQYNALKAVMNNLNPEIEDQAVLLKKLTAETDRLMNKMNAYQQSTGKHVHNIGNYSKALNGVDLATKQLVREVPTLANSVNQFFMAISNNIPIFIDNMQRAKKETGSMKAGIEQMLASIFSWQTLLIVGITLLAKYGSQIMNLVFHFKTAAARAKELMEITKSLQEQLKKYVEFDNRYYERLIVEQEKALKRMQATKVPLQKVYEAENELLETRRRKLESSKKHYASYIKNYDRYNQLYRKSFVSIQKLEEKVAKDGRDKDKKELENQKAWQALYKERLDIVDNLRREEANLYVDEISAAEKQRVGLIQRAADERQTLYETEEARNATIQEQYERRLAEIDLAYKRERDAILTQLKINEDSYTEAEKKAMNDRIKLLKEQAKQEKAEVFRERANAIAKARVDVLTTQNNLLADGYIKQLAIIETSFREQERVLKDKILNDKSITKQERTYLKNLLDWLPKQREQAIKALDLKHENDLIKAAMDHRVATIEVSNRTEYRKYMDSIDAQIDYWREYIRNIQTYGNLAEEELAIEVQKINDTIAKLEYSKKGKRKSLWDLLGIDVKKGELIGMYVNAIQDTYDALLDSANEYLSVLNEIAQKEVDVAKAKTEAAKEAFDYEREARANGYANNVQLARKEYEEKLALEQKAIEEKKRLEKIQEGIDTAQQISSLVTATANLWASYSSIPVVGLALAIAATTAMWGSFAAAKIKAAQMANAKTYGEGGMEYIDYGGSHASGHDVDFGRTKEGRPRRIEKGEAVAVINKRNVNRYGIEGIRNIVQALNTGTFDELYSPKSNMYALAFSPMAVAEDTTDLSAVERGIQTLVDQGSVRIVPTPYGRIEYRGNNKRIIRNS